MVHNKLSLAYSSLAEPGYLALIVIAVYLCVVVVWQRRSLVISEKANVLLAALLPLAFFIIALCLPTIWRQHLAIPVPFLIIGAAYPLLYLRKLVHKTGLSRHFKISCVLVALSLSITVVSYPIVLHRIPNLFSQRNWTAIELHKISQDIAEKAKSPKLILTLAPLYALEGGCDIYTELSAGSFVYRVADFMPPADRAVTHSVGPETLAGLLENAPPSAVILGVEMDFLEESLFRAAVERTPQNWEIKDYENGTLVYFRR